MKISKEEKQNLIDFFAACNEMIAGRFILSDTKVSNILKCIVKSELLYNLYSNCMTNFKFANILARSVSSNPNNGGYFEMPQEEKEIVAFVTCLLLEVDKKNISLQTFVTENFFSADGYNISYSNFALNVLVAYKTAVSSLLGVDESGKVVNDIDFHEQQVSLEESQEKTEADENTKILFANLVMSINELKNAINDDNKIKYNEKEDLLIVIKALNRAVHIEELLIINALLVPLEKAFVKHKRLKGIFENIKLLIADIYY